MTMKQKQTKPVPSLEQGITLTTEEAARFGALETTASSPTFASNGKKSLATALARAQAECQNVVMNKTNPHFRSRYADLAAVRDAIVPIFNKHGISIIQSPNVDGFAGFNLETRLIHESGEEIVWNFPLPSDVTKMQAVGSAISYARRYTLSAIACIASEEDDDGNAATNPNGGGQSGRGAVGGTTVGGSSPTANGGIVL